MLFSNFEKYKEIHAKMVPKRHGKSFEMDRRGAQGLFVHRLYGFWAVPKNRCFFRWRTGASKNRKHRAVEPQRVAKQFDQRTGVSLSGRRVPTQQENNTALTAIQPIKDPDMLKGRRPGEFEALLFFRHLFHSES